MPYTLETKDGIVIRNVPDDAPEADLRARVAQVRAQRGQSAAAPTEAPAESADQSLIDSLFGRDDRFDYSGVPNARFRAGLSRMDNDAERKRYLERAVGPDGYTQDRFGRLALTPPGLQKLGIKADRPRIVDERGLSRYDVADLAGDAPAIAGGVVAGTLAAPVALPAAIGLAALGAAGGKGFGEAAEALQGVNLQGPGETAVDLAKEGGSAALGEGIFRGILAPVGRYLMGPEAKRVTPAIADLAKKARDLGAKPSVSQITKAPLLGRSQAMAHRVFGDPTAAHNSAALHKEMERLSAAARGGRAGAALDPSEVGKLAVQDITRGRKALSRWAGHFYGKVDDMLGGAGIQTDPMKKTARDIMASLPKNAQGEAVLTDKALLASLREVDALPERMTLSQLQAIRSRFHDAISDTSIVPGLASRNARMMRDAATDAMKNVDDPAAADLLKRVNAAYSREIKNFDDALVKRITRDPHAAGAIPPEHLVSSIFKKDTPSLVNRVMPLLKKPRQEEVRNLAMRDLMGNVIRQTDDPLVTVFDGKALQSALDAYGSETLEAMFGKTLASDLQRFADVTKFISQGQMGQGGQLAAQAMALHPIANLGALAKLNVIGKFMRSDTGIKYLTEGFRAPKTRAGAAALSRAAVMLNQLAEEEQKQAPQSQVITQ